MMRSRAQLRAIFAAMRGKGTLGRARHLRRAGILTARRDARGAFRLGGGVGGDVSMTGKDVMRALGLRRYSTSTGRSFKLVGGPVVLSRKNAGKRLSLSAARARRRAT